MKYTKSVSITGGWIKASELKTGQRAKIVSETIAQPSQFTNKDGSPKTQDVAKLRLEGQNDPLNVSLNRATINGLIDAFGEDSIAWQNHLLIVETEKVRVAGKNVTALYLVPEGYEKTDDANGYAVIIKKGSVQSEAPVDTLIPPDEVNVDEIPF